MTSHPMTSPALPMQSARFRLADSRLTVSEALTRGSGGRNVFGSPKPKAGSRTMAVPGAIVEMLSQHLARRGLDSGDVDALVFTDEDGRPLRDTNWRRRVWLPAVEAAGCLGAGFHDLRRLNATSLVVGGVDVKTAQVRLGHADPRMTLAIYASAPASADRAAAEVLGATFFGDTTQQ
jgi:integrase